MNTEEINLNQTHIRLTTDLTNHNLKHHIFKLRQDLQNYITRNKYFQLSFEPIKITDTHPPLIIKKMIESSQIADVGPMACVAGTIAELSLNYLIANKSSYSIVENGGDIAVINDKKIICGIYSNNNILGNKIAFKLKKRKKPLGICTSSGKIGHSISFGSSDSVTVISKSASISDGLATRIANEVRGDDKINNALEVCENYRQYFIGVLIISDDEVGTIGKLPEIVSTDEFEVKP